MATLITPWFHEPLATPGFAGGLAQQWWSPAAARPRIQLGPPNADIYGASGACYTPRRSLHPSGLGILPPHVDDGVRSVSVPPIPRTPWDARVPDITRRAPCQLRQRPVALPLAAVRIGHPATNLVGGSFRSSPEESGYVLPEGPAISPHDVSPLARKVYPTHARLNAAAFACPVEHPGARSGSVPASRGHSLEPVARSTVELHEKDIPSAIGTPLWNTKIEAVSPVADQLTNRVSHAVAVGTDAPLESSPQNSVWKRYFAGDEKQFSRPLCSSRVSRLSPADSSAGADEFAGLGIRREAAENETELRAMPVRRPSAHVRRYPADVERPSVDASSLPRTAPNSARDDAERGQVIPQLSTSVGRAIQELGAESVQHKPTVLHQVVSKFGPPPEEEDFLAAASAEAEEPRAPPSQPPMEEMSRTTIGVPPAQGEVVLNSAQVEAIALAAAAVEQAARATSLKQLHELRSFRQPPAVVCQVVDAVSTLLGCYEPTWSTVKRRLDSALLWRLTSFSAMEAARCPSSRVQGFLELLEAPAFCDGSLADKCPAVAPLAEWCMAVAHLMLQLRATDAETRPAEADSNSNVAAAAQEPALQPETAPPDLGGLYVNPPLWELEDSALCCVDDLVVGRDGVGHITFHGQTDCRNLLNILPKILMVEQGEIVVYPDATLKPEAWGYLE
ncbi:NUP98 [Symbiodinium natans]|uniref:NUP98 protein n=1 Tax=Symbiodinium natans TaxID=878477 RepID=A0A812PTD4_9DINO|nr:NUP98 [Symbiodinium natans]